MIVKYEFMIQGNRIALDYNDRNKVGWVGGYSRDRKFMINLLQYFIGYIPRMKYIQNNKIRFNFSVSLNVFETRLELLEEEGFAFEKVKGHGRLTR